MSTFFTRGLLSFYITRNIQLRTYIFSISSTHLYVQEPFPLYLQRSTHTDRQTDRESEPAAMEKERPARTSRGDLSSSQRRGQKVEAKIFFGRGGERRFAESLVLPNGIVGGGGG